MLNKPATLKWWDTVIIERSWCYSGTGWQRAQCTLEAGLAMIAHVPRLNHLILEGATVPLLHSHSTVFTSDGWVTRGDSQLTFPHPDPKTSRPLSPEERREVDNDLKREIDRLVKEVLGALPKDLSKLKRFTIRGRLDRQMGNVSCDNGPGWSIRGVVGAEW